MSIDNTRAYNSACSCGRISTSLRQMKRRRIVTITCAARYVINMFWLIHIFSSHQKYILICIAHVFARNHWLNRAYVHYFGWRKTDIWLQLDHGASRISGKVQNQFATNTGSSQRNLHRLRGLRSHGTMCTFCWLVPRICSPDSIHPLYCCSHSSVGLQVHGTTMLSPVSGIMWSTVTVTKSISLWRLMVG